MFLNAKTIINLEEDISMYAKEKALDLVIIAETRWNKERTPFKNTIIQCLADHKGQGGILAFSPSGKCKQARVLESKYNWAIIQIKTTIIGMIYYAPRSDVNFIREFINNMEEWSNFWNKEVIIVGDFNARLEAATGDHAHNARGQHFFNLMSNLPLKLLRPVENIYTTKAPKGQGVTDLLFCTTSSEQIITDFRIPKDTVGKSDHFPLLWKINTIKNHMEEERKWNLNLLRNKTKIQELYKSILCKESVLDKIEDLNKSRIINQSDINNIWRDIEEWIKNALSKSCKFIDTSNNQNLKIFFNKDLLESRDQLKTADAQERPVIFKKYLKNLIKRKEIAFVDFLANITKPAKRGDYFKFVSAQTKQRSMCNLDPDMLDQHAEHFTCTFGGKPTGKDNEYTDNISKTQIINNDVSFEYLVTLEEMDIALKKMKLCKAPGVDGIPAEALKLGGTLIRRTLTLFFNMIMKVNLIPDIWKESLIIPIYKGKGPKENIKSYRPIALTVVAKRLFEKILDKKMAGYRKLLNKTQGGFLEKRSTLDQVYILNEIMKYNQNLAQVFLDFRAAYDLVDRNILWKYLEKGLKFDGHLVALLKTLFNNNHSRILVSGEKSKKIPNLRGLPQGSSLSPILFNFFIDTLIKRLDIEGPKINTKGFKSNNLFFADDGNIHANTPDDLQKILNICSEWSINVGMIFAPEKCVVLSRQTVKVKLSDDYLPQNEEVKYLGIPLNPQGISYNSLINNNTKKAIQKTLGIIRSGLGASYWSHGIKLSLYKQFIRPCMEYGLQLSLSDGSSNKKLEATQQKSIRILMKLPWNTSAQAIRRLYRLESMETRSNILMAKFFRRGITSKKFNPIMYYMIWKSREDEKSILGQLRLQNPVFLKIVNSQNLKDIIEIRRMDIMNPKKGAPNESKTNVADCINVPEDLKPDPLLSWKNQSEAKRNRNIINWKLGRIATHQKCGNCSNSELSRKHAVMCSGVEDELRRKYPDTTIICSTGTIIDEILLQQGSKPHTETWEDINWAINQIRKLCLMHKEI
jgi:hypothetical protein